MPLWTPVAHFDPKPLNPKPVLPRASVGVETHKAEAMESLSDRIASAKEAGALLSERTKAATFISFLRMCFRSLKT